LLLIKLIYNNQMDKFFNTRAKKVIFFVIIIAVIEISGHGILASLFRLLSSAN
tara:strand:- start:1803 stop:1961 length:159 start_codon:yes stop_codon:yes gene_type:complete